jgi:nicotinamide-nucleotide amidase
MTAPVEQLVSTLIEHGLTLATAESVTGGMCGWAVVEVPDSGQVMLGSVVAYASAVKHRVLGVDEGPVVSARCAEQMAESVMKLFGADCALAFTGVAGPAEQEGHPVGTVFITAASGSAGCTREFRFEGDPTDIRMQAIDAGARLLTQLVTEEAGR